VAILSHLIIRNILPFFLSLFPHIWSLGRATTFSGEAIDTTQYRGHGRSRPRQRAGAASGTDNQCDAGDYHVWCPHRLYK